MKFGLFTCGYQNGPLEKAFSDAVEFGYDYIELWGGKPHAYVPDLIQNGVYQIRALVDKYNMPIRVFTPEHNAYPFNYMEGDDAHKKESILYLKSAIQVGKQLGAEYTLISMGYSGLPEPDRQIRLKDSIKELNDEADRIDHKIVLETLTPFESDICTKLEDYYLFLESSKFNAVYAMCDVVPPFVQGEDPSDYAYRFGDRLKHIHLVDSDGISDTHYIPGDGIMPLQQIMSRFRNFGYDGLITLELVTNYINNQSEAAYKALINAKELFI